MASDKSHSRRELLETIEQQKDQIGRYEARLRDVVHAYKGLVKEKEALENSLKILEKNPEAAESESENTSEDRITTLTSSLATLTAEKSRLESGFQEDKKKLRAELIEKDKTIEALKDEFKNFKDKTKFEMEESKSKLIIERHNREKETDDHALMLRELQKLASDERSSNEKLESELQNAKDSLKALELAGTYNAEYEKRVRILETDLKDRNELIKDLKVKAEQTPPELLKLKEELNDIKLGKLSSMSSLHECIKFK